MIGKFKKAQLDQQRKAAYKKIMNQGRASAIEQESNNKSIQRYKESEEKETPRTTFDPSRPKVGSYQFLKQ